MRKSKNGFKQKIYGAYNGGKKNKGEGFKKILSGVLFAAACFAAIFVLLEFHDKYWIVAIACVVLMAAAYFFLSEIFSSKEEVIDDLVKAQEALDEVKEEDRQKAEEEFKKTISAQVESLDRTSRAMFAAMKRNADVQGAHLEAMQDKIDKVIDEQNAGIKTVIKYNKENARQVAESEKQTLEYVMNSINTEIKGSRDTMESVAAQTAVVASVAAVAPVLSPDYYPSNASTPVVNLAPPPKNVHQSVDEVQEEPAVDFEEELPVIDEMAAIEEIPVIDESELTEETPIIDEATEVNEELPVDEVSLTDEVPVIDELTSDEETPVIDEIFESEPEAEPEPEPAASASEADLAAATGVDLSDPNAALSADDIAKLFAAANGGGAEPAPEPEPEPAAPASEADLAAATGVDLSDPNAALSADDIAKLFAAAGN